MRKAVCKNLHRHRQCKAGHRLKTLKGDGVLQAADARRETVDGGVDNAQQFRCQGGIGLNQIDYLFDSNVFIRQQTQ